MYLPRQVVLRMRDWRAAMQAGSEGSGAGGSFSSQGGVTRAPLPPDPPGGGITRADSLALGSPPSPRRRGKPATTNIAPVPQQVPILYPDHLLLHFHPENPFPHHLRHNFKDYFHYTREALGSPPSPRRRGKPAAMSIAPVPQQVPPTRSSVGIQ